MNIRTICAVWIVALLSATDTNARLSGGLDIKRQVSESPIICAGHLSHVITEMEKDAGGESAISGIAGFVVDHVIKGSLQSSTIRVKLWSAPSLGVAETAFTNYPSALWKAKWVHRRVLYCLSRSTSKKYEYVLWSATGDTDGLVTSLAPTPPSGLADLKGVDEKLEAELIAAIRTQDPEISSGGMRWCWHWGRRTPVFLKALQEASESTEMKLSTEAVGIRIHLEDMTVFPLAMTNALAGGKASYSVGRALEEIRNPALIPELQKFLKVKDESYRRAASFALSEMADRKTKNQLKSIFLEALDDPDRQVQYNALRGLHTIWFNPDRKDFVQPNLSSDQKVRELFQVPRKFEIFLEDPDKYIRAWKNAE